MKYAYTVAFAVTLAIVYFTAVSLAVAESVGTAVYQPLKVYPVAALAVNSVPNP